MVDSADTRIQPVDNTLLSRIVERDASALGELYDLHANRLYALIRRILGDQLPVDETLLETFRQVWEHPDRAMAEFASSLAWLTRTARDLAVDRLMLEQSPTPREEKNLPTSGVLTAGQVEIVEAMSQLPVEEWSVIEHAYFHGYTLTKLAEHFELPVEAVRARIHQGMLSLLVRFQHLVGERAAPVGSLYLDELTALDAVGALDGEDIGEFKRIAPNVNRDTQKEMARYREVASLFASLCDGEKHPPAELKERLMRLIQGVQLPNHQAP